MLPVHLNAGHFTKYPPEAKRLVLTHLPALRQMPVSFLPSLLREVIEYDYKFPRERTAIDAELASVSALSPSQLAVWFSPFWQLRISAKLEQFDWINEPAQFTEQLSAYLWSSHQMDAFRAAATTYGDHLQAAATPESLPVRRLGIAVIGQGVASYQAPLFQNLRQHGTYFSRVQPENGLGLLLDAAAARAQAHPAPYGHWYVDGGISFNRDSLLTSISYDELEGTRVALLNNIQREISKPGMGPEQLHTYLAGLAPAQLGLQGDATLDRFKVKLLTEGSGTQIFSTTFAQWTAREVLRRAQALTLLVRYAPRQRERPMNELLSSGQENPALDTVGSLIDADMGAYYQWINQQRLAGAEHASFLVWFEGHRQAIAIGPTLPRGAESNSEIDLKSLLALATG